MIKREFSKYLGMLFFRNFLICNMMFGIAAICLTLIWYRIYLTKNGSFRKHLLWYFGTGATTCWLAMLLWHPFFNEWLLFVLAIPHLFTLVKLSIFMFVQFGGKYD